ncbi:MAG: hypothetical protein P9M02_02290 [Candidatus Susulua stagnicola]|nr:hypothetical protein [Candidatus Susulua stagnicola]
MKNKSLDHSKEEKHCQPSFFVTLEYEPVENTEDRLSKIFEFLLEDNQSENSCLQT